MELIRTGDEAALNSTLFSGNNFKLFYSLDSLMSTAIDYQRWHILQILYEYKTLHLDLFSACILGTMGKIDQLLQHPHISLMEAENFCIIVAIQSGNVNVVQRLIRDERIQMLNNYEILHALIEHDRPKIMDLLLPLLQPNDNNNIAIREAAELGRYELVDILMKDRRVNAAACSNAALRLAAKNGFDDVVERLLQDPFVDPRVYDNLPLYLAAKYGHIRIVERLLLDPRVNAAARNNGALFQASYNNHSRIVERLLHNYDVLTKGSLTSALNVAIYSRNDQIVKLLREAKKSRREIRSEKGSYGFKNAIRMLGFRNVN